MRRLSFVQTFGSALHSKSGGSSCYAGVMRRSNANGDAPDPFRAHDLEISRRDSPAEKLAQALELMESGIDLKRAALRQLRGSLTEKQLADELTQWLCSDG